MLPVALKALEVKLGSPSATCGPAHGGEGEHRPPVVWEEEKEKVLPPTFWLL